MGGSSRFMHALTAVLFLAVCAYLGAALFDSHIGSYPVSAAFDASADGVELNGIAIRSEQCICSDLSAVQTAQEGLRISCGGTLAVLSDGKRIPAPCSAIFFPDTDGYETLSPGMLQELSAERLETLMASPPDSSPAIGRIVCDCVWYYAALADSDAVFPEDRSCFLRFSGMCENVPARIVSLSAVSGGRRAVVFRLNRGGDYLSLRRVTAEAVFPDAAE